MSGNYVLTEDVEEKLFLLIAGGNYPGVACEAVGISTNVYHNWIKRGEGRDRTRPPTSETVAFAARMRQAEALAEVKVVEEVKKGMEKDPSLGLKFLSRRWRERWGEVVTHKNDWTFHAIVSLKNGEVTWDDLKGAYNETQLAEIKARMLESGDEVEGQFTEVNQEESVESDAA